MSLPVKTKIAALWLAAIGSYLLYTTLSKVAQDFRVSHTIDISLQSGTTFALFFFAFPGLILAMLPAFFLFKRKKIGYYWALFALSIGLFYITQEWVRIFILGVKYPYCLFKTLPICERISYATQTLSEAFRENIKLSLVIVTPFSLLFFDRKNFFKIAT